MNRLLIKSLWFWSTVLNVRYTIWFMFYHDELLLKTCVFFKFKFYSIEENYLFTTEIHIVDSKAYSQKDQYFHRVNHHKFLLWKGSLFNILWNFHTLMMLYTQAFIEYFH